MIEERGGNHKGGRKGKARGRGTVNITASCGKPPKQLNTKGIGSTGFAQGGESLISEDDVPNRRWKWMERIDLLIANPGRALRLPVNKDNPYERLRSGLYHAARTKGVVLRIEQVDGLMYVRLLVQRKPL